MRVLEHLLALPPEDRRLRFGHAIGPDVLQDHVKRLDFTRVGTSGALDDQAVMDGFGHLGFERNRSEAEFGISLLEWGLRRGIGRRLIERAARHARTLARRRSR